MVLSALILVSKVDVFWTGYSKDKTLDSHNVAANIWIEKIALTSVSTDRCGVCVIRAIFPIALCLIKKSIQHIKIL